MFDPESRYYDLETVTQTLPDGRVIAYKRRRFLPRPEDISSLMEVEVTEGDRLDLIAAKTLGESELFWRICDANNGFNPFDLVEVPGRRLRIPRHEI